MDNSIYQLDMSVNIQENGLLCLNEKNNSVLWRTVRLPIYLASSMYQIWYGNPYENEKQTFKYIE